jgi:hypothetical protein
MMGSRFVDKAEVVYERDEEESDTSRNGVLMDVIIWHREEV